MNVIKFTIEIKKRVKSFCKKSISDLITKKIGFEFNDAQYLKKCKEKWDQLEYLNVKSLKSKESVHSYYIDKNVQIFAFVTNSHMNEILNNHSITLEIISVGDMTVDNLLNISFNKLANVYNDIFILCKHIGETRIYIFPFSSENQDIYSYDLKIRANILKPFGLNKNDIFKWIIFIMIIIATGIYYFTIKDENDVEVKKNIILSIIGSAIFFIITDLILLIIVPFLAKGKSRIVQINDLSSVVETKSSILSQGNQPEKISIPE